MTTTVEPEDFTEGLGELVRQMRAYLGVSQRTFGDLVGCSERSVSDIEIGRRDTPRGFITSCEAVLTKFDADVDAATTQAEKMLDGDEESVVNITVNDEPETEYHRAVFGRAAVLDGVILPILDGTYHARKREQNARQKHYHGAKDRAVPFSDRGC